MSDTPANEKNFWMGAKLHVNHFSSKVSLKCSTKHESRSFPAFGKTINSYPTILQKIVIQRKRQPTKRKTVCRSVKLKKVRAKSVFPMEILLTSRMINLKPAIYVTKKYRF